MFLPGRKDRLCHHESCTDGTRTHHEEGLSDGHPDRLTRFVTFGHPEGDVEAIERADGSFTDSAMVNGSKPTFSADVKDHHLELFAAGDSAGEIDVKQDVTVEGTGVVIELEYAASPLPLTFALELLTGSGWLPIIANLFALASALPILMRTQAAAAGVASPRITLLPLAALGLLLALIPVAAASTLNRIVMWLSMVTVVMLARSFTTRTQLLLLIVLSAADIVVPGLIGGDGLTFVFGASTVIVAGLTLGLLLRMVDCSLLERHATAAEAERRRMATELHDLVAHEVTGIVVLSQAAARSEDAGILKTALGKNEESGSRALDEIRSLVSNSSADSSDPGPLSPVASSIQALVDRANGFADAQDLTLDTGSTNTERSPPSSGPAPTCWWPLSRPPETVTL